MRLLAQKRNRSAFTLIELIVVMAIILVIAALGIGAAAKGLGWVKQRNTETTMSKVLDRIIKKRLGLIYKEARDWPTPTQILSQANGDATRAEVLKILYLYKWSFPQTYSESFYNIQESILIDSSTFPNGYPNAVAIYQKLLSRAPAGITPQQFIMAPANVTDMAKVIPVQTSACLLAAYQQFGSKDEFAPAELSQPSAAQIDVPPQPALPNGAVSSNDLLVDAWGTPFFFLRHGNYWDNLGQRGPPIWTFAPFMPFQMGLVPPNPPTPVVPPVPAVLEPNNGQPNNGPHYYDILVNTRAFTAYKSTWNTDPFDPNGTLRESNAWRTFVWINGTPWMTGAWLAPASGTHNEDYFVSNFGYRPQPSNLNGRNRWPQEYTPLVIISAGGDKLFNTWNDNLDSYRLQVNLSGTQ
jgi:prepilin-type N-terminal cleavage/methylation domain-containing protein